MKRIDPSPGYRMLRKDESIRKTDEFTYNRGKVWLRVNCGAGEPMDREKYWPIRRKLLA